MQILAAVIDAVGIEGIEGDAGVPVEAQRPALRRARAETPRVAVNVIALAWFGERLGLIQGSGVALAIVAVALITLGPAAVGRDPAGHPRSPPSSRP